MPQGFQTPYETQKLIKPQNSLKRKPNKFTELFKEERRKDRERKVVITNLLGLHLKEKRISYLAQLFLYPDFGAPYTDVSGSRGEQLIDFSLNTRGTTLPVLTTLHHQAKKIYTQKCNYRKHAFNFIKLDYDV